MFEQEKTMAINLKVAYSYQFAMSGWQGFQRTWWVLTPQYSIKSLITRLQQSMVSFHRAQHHQNPYLKHPVNSFKGAQAVGLEACRKKTETIPSSFAFSSMPPVNSTSPLRWHCSCITLKLSCKCVLSSTGWKCFWRSEILFLYIFLFSWTTITCEHRLAHDNPFLLALLHPWVALTLN